MSSTTNFETPRRRRRGRTSRWAFLLTFVLVIIPVVAKAWPL